ncbi:DUF4365 domain-containing protein [Microbacterium sp. NPDC089698]|uniref:DUF4365 domain-containing protein n=1 Tax=Microbacterium sp. NPDC089698 TaxID=3364200 RepID=UPI003804FB89
MTEKPKQSRPKRVQQHKLESRSGAVFAVTCRDSWAVHTIDGSLDYGRDRWVEVFDDGDEATGIEFGVQLKSAAAAADPPRVKIKRTTLNLWESLPTPTLIFFYDKASDSRWYEWAHLLPWQPPKNTKSRTVQVTRRWDSDTPALIEREAMAFRAAARVIDFLPLDVVVTGETFLGADSGPLIAALTDYVSRFRELRLRFSARTPLHAYVNLSDAGIEISLAGMRPRPLTYGSMPPNISGVAADVMFALAFHLRRAGAESLATRILGAAASESYMIISAGHLGDAVAVLMQAQDLDDLEGLLKRSAAIENHPNGSEAIASVLATSRNASTATRIRVADLFQSVAPTWANPAVALSIAARVLGHIDREQSRGLWELAAASDSSISETIPYLLSQAGLAFETERFADAVDLYRRAVALGEESARPLLADAMLWAGTYADSLLEFSRAGIETAPEHAEWRLKLLALKMITHGLQTTTQVRDGFAAEMRWRETQPNPSDEQIHEIIQIDALYGWAHWRLCAADKNPDHLDRFGHLAVATISLPGMAAIWQELACCALSDESTAPWVLDIMLCVKRYCGAEFVKLLHTDTHVDLDTRRSLLFIYEHAEEYSNPGEIGTPAANTPE